MAAYSKYARENLYPPADATAIKDMVGDGHAKVVMKCVGKPERAGRPRTRKVKKSKGKKSKGKKTKGKALKGAPPVTSSY